MDVREKLVELLSQVQSYGVKQGNHITHQEGKTNREIASHLIACGVTVQEWISVKDRLPEKNTSVLGYRESGRCVLFYDRYGFCEIDEYGQDRAVDDVTHWMPLPMPPKGD